MRKTMLMVLAAATIAACRSSAPPSPEGADQQQAEAALDDTVRLALGESRRVEPFGLTVTFDSVLADSRCARDVVCVWAGSARVRLTMFENAGAGGRYVLESGQEPRSATIGANTVTLIEVQPEPVSGREIGRGYRIALRMTRP